MRHRFALCLCAHSPVPPLLFCAQMPDHVLKVLQALPKGTHPMTQFAQGILALQVGPGLLVQGFWHARHVGGAWCLVAERC